MNTLLLMSDAREDATSDSISGYGLVVAGNVHEALLPDSSGSPAALPAPVRAKAARLYLQ
ncbi:hypothetical protein [Deinococcus sp. ME38]|uniref:hypothetical protein n=1 Tax=Deinococcus sp. ME38 TaxID=3400344 RepID=UPI003B5BABD8